MVDSPGREGLPPGAGAGPRPVTPRIRRIAWALAVTFDLLQWVLFPVTVEGGFSIVDDGLDLLAFATFTLLLGWHWHFLPSFITKLIPLVDLAPTWTLAVAWATHRPKPDPSPAGGP